ncbi:hypothetical protein E5K21_002561 [Enterococcus faecalis]|nr:hypothetical protein [Enterococcus faecalis]
MKHDRVITTKPVSEAELFDSPIYSDRYPVKPSVGRKKKGTNERGLPFFLYYSSNKPVGINLGGPGSKVTMAHAVFQDIFSTLPHFLIETKYKKELIKVIVDGVTVDLRVKVSDEDYYIVEIMYRLKQTEPYSFYYKWNGYLAMEVVVTSPVTKDKVDRLSNKGIQVCEFKVPKSIEEELRIATHNLLKSNKQVDNIEFSEETEFFMLQREHQVYKRYYEKYYYLYESGKFVAYCNLIGDVETKPEWKEMYINMKQYEQQEAEMIRRITEKREELTKLEVTAEQYRNRITQIKNKEVQLEKKSIELQESSEKIERIKEKNLQLKMENNSLLHKNRTLILKNKYVEKHPIKNLFEILINKFK